MTVSTDQVRAFWEREAAGERYGEDQTEVRYRLEPEILEFADFDSAAGARVLEIGVGMGADFVRWLQCGADAVGVDLTERAVRLTSDRVRSAGFEADVRVADAEHLPFDAGEFDLVYSWGVLHHTPHVAAAFAEATRVLRPGGRLKVMVYHRRSWVALAAWGRFSLLRGHPFERLRDAVAHVESPGTQAFTTAELRSLLGGLEQVEVRPVLTSWDRRMVPGLSRLVGGRMGWFLLGEGRLALT